MPQSQAAANPWHQEEEKKDKNLRMQTNKQMHEKHIDHLSLSSPSELITMLNSTGKKKHENKEQGKTQHKTHHSKYYKATQNKSNTRTTAIERSVA